MPHARIITAFPESVESLAEYLAERGYQVETLAPNQAPKSACDLEITIEAYGREQAFERAQELASELGADVLVAPGVMTTEVAQPANLPIEPELAEVSGEEEASGLLDELPGPAATQRIRESLNRWRTQAAEAAVAARNHFINTSQALGSRALVLATDWRQRGAKWAAERQEARRVAHQRAAEAAGARAQALELERAEAAKQAQARALARDARRRELEAQRQLEQQQMNERRVRESAERAMFLREQQAREAAVREARIREQQAAQAALEAELKERETALRQAHAANQYAELIDELDEVPIAKSTSSKPWRVAVRPHRSGLGAYTRNRDWRMAFAGAAAASVLIIMVSVGFMHRAPAKLDVQHRLPFGAATTLPNTPSLLVTPAALPSPPVQIQVATKKPKAKPATVTAEMSRPPEPPEDEYLGEEVVVRHYPPANAVKARTGQDGIKRISDLE